jgi:hypothetical protein
MADVIVKGDTSGAVTLSAPAVAGTVTVTLPSTTGTMAVLPTATGVLAESAGGTGTTTGYYGFKSRIINGGMTIDQRNAGASVTPSNSYTLDRWTTFTTQASKFTIQQNAGSLSAANRPTGFINYLGATSSSAFSVGAGDYFSVNQFIEGLNVADFNWGTANAQTITISFWVRSSLTGTFGGAITNDGYTRSYPFTYTISSANTWEQKTITVAGDQSGTWLTTNGVGLRLVFGLGVGSTYSGTAGAWAGTFYASATGATSVVGTNGATFYITGVQLEKGSTATSFDYRPYGAELALCQRYYQRIQGDATAQRSVANGVVGSTTAIFRALYPMKVSMRAAPTCTASGLSGYDGSANPNVSLGTFYQTAEQISFDVGGGSSYTVGRAGLILTGASTSSYFDASAEL